MKKKKEKNKMSEDSMPKGKDKKIESKTIRETNRMRILVKKEKTV